MDFHCQLHPLPYQADPAVYFERIHRRPGAILLDSGQPVASRGRFDILSAEPRTTLEPRDGEAGRDFFNRLRACLHTLDTARFEGVADLPFAGGLLGYLAYDFGRRLEHLLHAPEDDLLLPDARFGLYDWSLISDHLRRTSQLVFHPSCPQGQRQQLIELFSTAGEPERNLASNTFRLHGQFIASIDQQTYREAIARIHDYIRAGDCYQVNYTQRFQADYAGNPWRAYRRLRAACPTPFSAYLALGGDNAILSLSPERFLSLRAGRIEARPIKGTRPRGADPAADHELAQQLCSSVKDRAENLMIVDLLRNDIARSSRVGSVRVPELFSLESYPNVHHLVSSITADLAPGLDAFDLLAGSFPGGSITGAPKIRAMQIIDELEPQRRSLYCGSVLYVDVRGEMDSSITIRSLLAKDGRISCWGGGGIVMDSDWRDEHQESIDKVKVLLETLQQGSGARE